ncbi:MAG: T9SS type A sorting domain-containing protein [Flavobacteriales bacterium]|nr:T9SS type A sorting domain-containing protein [Flavobacteriales bacterium]
MTKPFPLALAAACLLSTATQAQNWTGAVSSDWNNAANWSDWPLGGENITVDPASYSGAAASPVIGTASVFAPDRLYVMNGAELTIAANLTVGNRFIISDDAQVGMTAGTLVVDRLIMELGGGFTLEAGTISAGRLVLGDDGEGPSTYTQQAGSVTVSGEFGFDCAVGPSAPVITLNGGSLVSNTDAIALGAAPSTGAGTLAVNGGSLTINGSLANSLGSTIDLRVHVSDGSLTVNGPSIELVHASDSLVCNGGLVVLDASLVFRNDGVVQATAGSVRVDGTTELRGVGSYHFHHVDISTGATLRHTDPAEITVGGDWSNAGTFNADGNLVAFVGDGAQTVEGTPFFGLRVANNGPGITLTDVCTVEDALILDQGLVNFDTNGGLKVLHGATATSGSIQSYVNGPLSKVGNSAFTFPVGAGGQWRRIGMGAVNDQDTEFTAEFLPTAPANASSLAPGLTGVSTVEHWRLERAVTNDETTVQLFWEDAAASAVGDCDALVVAHWNGSAWTGDLSTTTGSCTGNDAGTVTSDMAIADFSSFTFGTSDGTIGLEEHAGPLMLAPYPQPADRGTWLSLPQGTRSIALYDLTGQRIATHALSSTADRYYLPTTELPTGLYLVQANSNGQVLATGRVVVGH